MSWISSLEGPTKGRHEEVPKPIQDEAEKLAKKSMEGDDDEADKPAEEPESMVE